MANQENQTNTFAPSPESDGTPFLPEPMPGERIGPFRLLQRLGEGGMGVVWEADQVEPIRRHVAVKFVKLGMDSKAIIARFEAERQALALMDHPNIAKVYDAGLTSAGKPYFAMELVKGLPITKYCDEPKLTIRQRMELFLLVCNAVQHAHQKGVIHRDLKPSNVLVALYDGKPVPKIIDFGLAKALHHHLTNRTIFTEQGMMLGTPEYMAPEQASVNALDIDTRADIYSLGVILYELMTGQVPFERKELRQVMYDEMLRMIREVEPPIPSKRLSSIATLSDTAIRRGLEPKSLVSILRGDIDWIVMKALEKDRNRRYETANGFGMDVQRFLDGKAVLAHPPSRWYLAQKFVKRNRGRVLAAGLVIMTLIAGLAGSLWQMYRAIDAEALAKKNEGTAKDNEKLAGDRLVQVVAEKKKFEQEKLIAQAVRDFLRNSLIRQASVREQANVRASANTNTQVIRHNVTIKELLDRAAQEFSPELIIVKFPNQPETQAEILETIGEAYEATGDFKEAIRFVTASWQLRENAMGSHHPETLAGMVNSAFVHLTASRQGEAISLMLRVLERMEKNLSSPPGKLSLSSKVDDRIVMDGNLVEATLDTTLAVVKRRLDLRRYSLPTVELGIAEGAMALMQIGNALPRLQRLAALAKEHFSGEDWRTCFLELVVGFGYHATGQLPKAVAIYESTLIKAERLLDKDDMMLVGIRQILVISYTVQGVNQHEVISILRKSYATMERVLGPDHPATFQLCSNLALAYQKAGKLPESIALLEKVHSSVEKILGVDDPQTLSILNNLAIGYMNAGKFTLALPLLENVFKHTKVKLGADHPATLKSMNNLAECYRATERLDLALSLHEETLKLRKAKLGANHPDTLSSMNNLALGYHSVGKLDLSLPLFEEALKLRKAKLGANHPDTLNSMNNLATGYQSAGKLDLALPLHEETLKFRKAKLGADHPSTLISMNNLAMVYRDAGKHHLALPLFEETLKLSKAKLGADHPNTLRTMNNLGRACCDAKKGERASEVLKEFTTAKRQQSPNEDPGFAGTLTQVSLDLLKCDQFTAAEEMLREALSIHEKKEPNIWTTFNTQSMLGGALLGQKKYVEAEPLLLKGYSGMVSRLPQDTPGADTARLAQNKTLRAAMQTRLVEALDRLIQVYTETNKPDEVKKWKREKLTCLAQQAL